MTNHARLVIGLLAITLLTIPTALQAQGAPTDFLVTGPDRAGLYKAIDFNPSPTTVEVVLVAYLWPQQLRGAQQTVCAVVNGTTPGPIIEANKGDRLIVHFFNYLPTPHTIHWHGVELPANQDGSHISQLAVPAYGGYFKYEFDVLNAHTAWYHTHVGTMEWVERGFFGPIIFRDVAEDTRLGLPTSEATLVLDDVMLYLDGTHAPPKFTDPARRAELQLNGREGDVLLTNGSDAQTIDVKSGVPERWRLINTSNTRFMRVSIPGHNLYRIGGDAGLISAPVTAPPIDLVPARTWPTQLVSNQDQSLGILLTPGERADVVWTPLVNAGKDLFLEWHDLRRGRHTVFKTATGLLVGHDDFDGWRGVRTLLRIKVKAGISNPVEYKPPSKLRPVVPINTTGARMLMIMFGHMNPTPAGDVMFFAQMKNGKPLPMPLVTPADAHTVKVGETCIWNVVNMTMGHHNFHTHGFTFQPLELRYQDEVNPANNRTVPFPFIENKDVVIIPARPGAKGTSRTILRAAVKFDDTGRVGQIEAQGKVPTATTSGGWLVHCHILEHATQGMMTFIQVTK